MLSNAMMATPPTAMGVAQYAVSKLAFRVLAMNASFGIQQPNTFGKAAWRVKPRLIAPVIVRLLRFNKLPIIAATSTGLVIAIGGCPPSMSFGHSFETVTSRRSVAHARLLTNVLRTMLRNPTAQLHNALAVVNLKDQVPTDVISRLN